MSVFEKMTALANAIREKTGINDKLSIDDMTWAVKGLSSLIVSTVTGKQLTLDDSTDLRVQSLRIFGKTTQNGTPTPEAPVPLESVGDGGSVGVTVCGKNLAGEVIEGVGLGFNGGINYVMKAYNCSTIYIPVTPKCSYTLSRKSVDSGSRFAAAFTAEKYAGERLPVIDNKIMGVNSDTVRTFTAPANAKYLYWYIDNSGMDVDLSEYMVNIGEPAVTFEPYNGGTMTVQKPTEVPVFLPGIPVSSGGNYTDENGQQWVCDEVDFARGKYVQRIGKYTFDGTETVRSQQNMTDHCWYDVTLPDSKNLGAVRVGEFYSTVFPFISTMSDEFGANRRYNELYFSAPKEYDAIEFIKGSTIVYELKNPIEHDLSTEELAQYAALHTNYPNTTIFNDGGAGMEVKYVADTKLYIDKKFAELSTALLNQ